MSAEVGMKIVRCSRDPLQIRKNPKSEQAELKFFSADRRLAQEPDVRISGARFEWQDRFGRRSGG